MTLAELLVLAAVVFGAGWLLWDWERRHETCRETADLPITGNQARPSSVRVVPPVGRKPR